MVPVMGEGCGRRRGGGGGGDITLPMVPREGGWGVEGCLPSHVKEGVVWGACLPSI